MYNIHKAERIKTNIYEEEDENTYINKYQLSKLFISTILYEICEFGTNENRKANPEEESYSKDTMEALESYRKAIDEIAAFMKNLKENPEERAYYVCRSLRLWIIYSTTTITCGTNIFPSTMNFSNTIILRIDVYMLLNCDIECCFVQMKRKTKQIKKSNAFKKKMKKKAPPRFELGLQDSES